MEYDNINMSNVEEVVEQTVKKQLETLMQIEHDQYLEENPGIKNGYYKRNLKTKYGELKQLSVPRNRDNSFHSAIVDNNKAVGIDELITSLYSNGVSTRRISNILRGIFNNRYSPSSISRITDLALEEVNRFASRKLDKRYIAVMLDGLFFYPRRETVDKEPIIFALGIKESGEYEILGFYFTIKESHNSYKDVLEDLYRRGLKESLLFIADGITDLDEEVMKIYPGSDFQLCTTHYMRGLKSKVKEKDIEIIEDANKMFRCSNKQEAIIKFNDLKNKWENRYPSVIYNTEKKLGQLLRFYDYPSKIRNSLKSTNEIERLNGEIRRRIKVVSSFPDEDSAMKVFYLKSIEFNSKHAFRKMNGYYKCNDEIKEIFNKRYHL